MSADKEKEWEDLTLDEKLTELGFTTRQQYDVSLNQTGLSALEVRMHAALDQLMDAGGVLGEIEAMTQPTATGNPTGNELNTCVDIYKLITEGDEPA